MNLRKRGSDLVVSDDAHDFLDVVDLAPEVLAMAGVIANYHVHCHLVLTDKKQAFGGHLEKGCRVLSLAEIVLMRVDGIKLARLVDEVSGAREQMPLASPPFRKGGRGDSPGDAPAPSRASTEH